MVKCKECGKELEQITWTHLQTHDMTVAEYRDKYGLYTPLMDREKKKRMVEKRWYCNRQTQYEEKEEEKEEVEDYNKTRSKLRKEMRENDRLVKLAVERPNQLYYKGKRMYGRTRIYISPLLGNGHFDKYVESYYNKKVITVRYSVYRTLKDMYLGQKRKLFKILDEGEQSDLKSLDGDRVKAIFAVMSD